MVDYYYVWEMTAKRFCEHCRGRNSSVGCVFAVLHDAAAQVRFSSKPPVEGIFPLELTWVLTLFPKNFRMRVYTKL